MNYKEIVCKLCGYSIRTNCYAVHSKACDGKGPPARRRSKKRFPFTSLDAVKVQKYYDENHNFMETAAYFKVSPATLCKLVHLGQFKTRNNVVTRKLLGRDKNGAIGWTTEYRSKVAKDAGCGGYRAKAGRSKKTYRVDSFGITVCLQSSFEAKLATILDTLQFRWIRPKHLWYLDKLQQKRKYYPDFYLPELDIYLDPKNSYLIKIDNEKIALVRTQNKINLLVISEKELTETCIKSLLKPPVVNAV